MTARFLAPLCLATTAATAAAQQPATAAAQQPATSARDPAAAGFAAGAILHIALPAGT